MIHGAGKRDSILNPVFCGMRPAGRSPDSGKAAAIRSDFNSCRRDERLHPKPLMIKGFGRYPKKIFIFVTFRSPSPSYG